MPTAVRRLGASLFAGLLLVSLAGPAAAALPAFDLTTLVQAEANLGSLVNAERTTNGLVALQLDPDVMAIARQRAETMAATDLFSHKNPDGSDVFDAIAAAGIPWFGAGEVLVWNTYATEADSTAQAVAAWLGSPAHRSILLSADFNYAGFGAAVSPISGHRYYAGVFLKRTDRTAAWTKAGTTSVRVLDATRARVTVRWTGGDPRLQVLTAGLRDYEVQRRVVGGAWRSLGLRTTTTVTETLPRARTYEYRIRARDRAGNRGIWSVVAVRV
ncbi:MAG: CAP domain-containing protein [Candidatus Limnocylindrales bacterium]|nr:CAP domain-containing protein [Candidatus Limnocylindrales bacterium]